MSWRTQGLYLHRTRKPHAIVGLPLRVLAVAAVVLAFWAWFVGEAWWPAGFALVLFSGRHNAYVGQTSSRYFRDQQHRGGDYARGKVGSPWGDLDLKIYPLPCAFPRNTTAREIQEKIWIMLLLPVYNVEWNSKNPRRIKRRAAVQQRIARNKKSARMWAPRLLRLGLYGIVMIGLVYQGWESWT